MIANNMIAKQLWHGLQLVSNTVSVSLQAKPPKQLKQQPHSQTCSYSHSSRSLAHSPSQNKQPLLLKETLVALKQLQLLLERQKEKNYILKEYFKKIEKVLYSQSTRVFEWEPMDYQQLELHMREMLRRLQDVQNSRLKSAPVIYKRENVKVYRVLPSQNQL